MKRTTSDFVSLIRRPRSLLLMLMLAGGLAVIATYATDPDACVFCDRQDDPAGSRTRGIGPHGPGGGPDEAANR